MPVFPDICKHFLVNATGMANMLICQHFANLGSAASKLCLHYLPMSYKKEARLVIFYGLKYQRVLTQGIAENQQDVRKKT